MRQFIVKTSFPKCQSLKAKQKMGESLLYKRLNSSILKKCSAWPLIGYWVKNKKWKTIRRHILGTMGENWVLDSILG